MLIHSHLFRLYFSLSDIFVVFFPFSAICTFFSIFTLYFFHFQPFVLFFPLTTIFFTFRHFVYFSFSTILLYFFHFFQFQPRWCIFSTYSNFFPHSAIMFIFHFQPICLFFTFRYLVYIPLQTFRLFFTFSNFFTFNHFVVAWPLSVRLLQQPVSWNWNFYRKRCLKY